jgi:hypothetical protein
MNYSIDKIYKLVGRDDEVAVLTFSDDSEECKEFGVSLTVIFEYTKSQREKFEKRFLEQIDTGEVEYLKVRSLGNNLTKNKEELLKQKGINSASIIDIFSMPGFNKNLFHKPEKRLLNELKIQMNSEPNGGDNNWIYGFLKHQVNLGVILHTEEYERYLALKLFFEPQKISSEERLILYPNDDVNEFIEMCYLKIKLEKGIISKEEQLKREQYIAKFANQKLEILKEELQNAGTNLKKLSSENPNLCKFLLTGTYKFMNERLNNESGKPIYIDWRGFLHIYFRHVEEFKVSNAFVAKDKFLLKPKDVTSVIKKVIDSVNEEIQSFWKLKSGQRFSKYGDQSLYFLGDYYTFHIEGDGRLSTFHISKNKI